MKKDKILPPPPPRKIELSTLNSTLSRDIEFFALSDDMFMHIADFSFATVMHGRRRTSA